MPDDDVKHMDEGTDWMPVTKLLQQGVPNLRERDGQWCDFYMMLDDPKPWSSQS